MELTNYLVNGMSKRPKARSLKAQYNAEFNALRNAIDRCRRSTHSQYKDYGGRGLTVEPSWTDIKTGFGLFLSEIGPKPDPSYDLDRINNNLGYVSGNVRWISHTENMMNRRKPVAACGDLGWGLGWLYSRDANGVMRRRRCQNVSFNDEIVPIDYAAQKLNLSVSTLRQRIRKGWSYERVFAATLYNPWGRPRIN